MAYVVRRWWGDEERNLPPDKFSDVLAELRDADDEHPDVALKHESEWTLSYGRARTLRFENAESGGPRHMSNVPPARVVELWNLLARGELAELEREPWLRGY